MAKTDRERWDRRYANPNKYLHAAPHRLLRQYAARGEGLHALELACGLGHNALWLASQGYTVDALDISLAALRKARAEQVRRGVQNVHFIVADLDHFPLPRTAYDLVVVFRFLDRRLFPAIRQHTRPGGLVIYETFNLRQLERRPTFRTEHLLEDGELPRLFPGWDVIEASDDGYTSAFVGRKPSDGPGHKDSPA